jgi:hypothetical protein
MASRTTHAVKSLNRELVAVVGSFAPNGTSAVSSASNKGKGWTVARSAAGRFTVTFADAFNDLVTVVATAQMAANNVDIYAQVGTYDSSAKTLIIRTLTGGTETDIAANANDRVNFVAWFRNSSIE